VNTFHNISSILFSLIGNPDNSVSVVVRLLKARQRRDILSIPVKASRTAVGLGKISVNMGGWGVRVFGRGKASGPYPAHTSSPSAEVSILPLPICLRCVHVDSFNPYWL
jgi:hypothetical protein